MDLIQGIGLWLVVINLVTLALYGLDKKLAKSDQWRISERTLLLAAFAGGGAGALAGMELFRHKTRKPAFRILVPVSIGLWVIILAVAVWKTGGTL